MLLSAVTSLWIRSSRSCRPRETRMRLLQRQVDTLANCERAAVLDRGRLGQVLRASAADVKAVLSRHSQEARKALQLFLRDRLCFTPMERDGRRGYRFQGEGTYNGLLSGEAFPPTMVAPTGSVRYWAKISPSRF